MRLRRLVGATLALAFLMVASLPAGAKGPGSATITGPGGTVEVSPGNYRYADDDPYWDLQSESGIIDLAFLGGDEVGERPEAELGEPLIATWQVGSRDVVQLIYIAASGGPVTHVAPDTDHGIRGGWYRAGPGLRAALEELGIEMPAPDPRSLIEQILSTLTAGMISKI